jgi:hypothetical protein
MRTIAELLGHSELQTTPTLAPRYLADAVERLAQTDTAFDTEPSAVSVSVG